MYNEKACVKLGDKQLIGKRRISSGIVLDFIDSTLDIRNEK